MIAYSNAGRGRRVVAPESPAELLRRAAAQLEQFSAPLSDHHWRAETDDDDEDRWVVASEGPTMHTDHGPVTLGGQWTVARDVPENVAQWMGVMGPQVAAPLAAWLRAEADCVEHLPDSAAALGRLGVAVQEDVTGEPAEPWGVRVTLSTTEQAVATARAILGETL